MSRRARKLFAGILTLAMVLTSITWPQTSRKVAAEELDLGNEEDVIVWANEEHTGYGHEPMQKVYLSQIVSALGDKYAYSKVSGQKITAYLQVEKCSVYSRIKVSGGNLDTESVSSNKELIGIMNTTSEKENVAGGGTGPKNNATYIHAGWGTSGGYGSGQGEKGTGIYKFAESSLTNSAGDNPDATQGMWLRRMSTDIEGYICGIKFGSVGSVTLSKPTGDGQVTVTEGFDESKVESTTKDSTDEPPKSESELKSEAEAQLQAQISEAKLLGKNDCLTEELYEALQKAITDAQAVLDNPSSTSTELNAAIESLQKALKDATNEAPVGLKKAIDYCKSLKEEDYTSDSFAKLAPAIATAEGVFADYGSKTNAQLKTARDALEAVRVALVPKMSTAESNPKDFRILSKQQVIADMGSGINLGNTMDGGLYTVSETSWQAAKTTKAYIKALHDAGFNTVRIPVTWGEHINDDYSIKEAWIGRVQEIVDYCIDQDMYAIINIHHDGAANHDNRGNNTPQCWLDTYQWDIEKVYQKYEGVWKTIANRFKDYDEHLIFESMNEVTDAHDGTTNEDTAVLNALNQLFVNTVRATGSNNTKRWLAFTGRFAAFSSGTTMPEDTLADKGEVGTTRLMFAVHIYKGMHEVSTPYRKSSDKSKGLIEYQTSLSSTVNNVNSLSKDIPIYIGEYGKDQKPQDGSETGMNNAERALDGEFVNAVARSYGVCPIVWDQGWGDYTEEVIKTATGSSAFIYWNRVTCEPVYKDIIEGMMRGQYADKEKYYNNPSDMGTWMQTIYTSYGHSSGSTDDGKVSKDPEITPATDITLSDTTVTLKAGERTTVTAESDSAGDVVLWSTDDDAVATVSQGNIHAKRSGITTIHAYSQSGSVEKDIKVVVSLSGNETAKAISTDKAYYSIERGNTAEINTILTPSDSQDEVTYFSSDTSVATVSSSGVITAVGAGTAFIIVTAASGVSTIVRVDVPKSDSSNHVEVGLHAYFNSGEVKGTPVNITGDGEYTATLDLSTVTENEAGITALKDMVSVYLKDENATNPAEIHPTKAQIRFDKVVVEDTELSLKSAEDLEAMWTKNKVETEIVDGTCFKSALKNNGQFDTNDPINGWDGSAVADSELSVNSSSHEVSFKNAALANATKISVTFTIRGLEFPAEKVKENEATAMTTTDENIIKLAQPGDTKEITLSLTPSDTDSKVTVYSTNAAVVSADGTAREVDADGKVKVTLTAVGTGNATVVAITENLLKVLYSVGVGDVEVSEPTDPTPPGLDGSVIDDPTTPGGSTPGGSTPGGDDDDDDGNGGNGNGGNGNGGNGNGGNGDDDGNGGNGTGGNGTGGNGTGGNGTGGNETATLTVSKKSVIIAAGKTASVDFTAPSTPGVKTSNAKVATAKVSGNKVSISVPKTATKGAAAKITLTAGTKSAVINVTVQNPAKKIKAAKKTVTVKAKKKVTAKFKVTATNKKKAAADTIKVTSKKTKIAKVVSYSVKKGKATVKIQGVKKGKTTVTLKIGKKSAKVTVKVK